MTECVWTPDSDGIWHGECGVSWMFNDGGPEENDVRFCTQCGACVISDDERRRRVRRLYRTLAPIERAALGFPATGPNAWLANAMRWERCGGDPRAPAGLMKWRR